MHAACERARQWVSAEADGELSRFERILLASHLGSCPPCREFHEAVGSFTTALRTAELETLEQPIEIGRVRRLRPSLRLAPAVAAMAVVAVGLGSILASSDLRAGSVGTRGASQGALSNLAAVDTMNLSKARALQRATVAKSAARAGRSSGSLRGGPVVSDR